MCKRDWQSSGVPLPPYGNVKSGGGRNNLQFSSCRPRKNGSRQLSAGFRTSSFKGYTKTSLALPRSYNLVDGWMGGWVDDRSGNKHVSAAPPLNAPSLLSVSVPNGTLSRHRNIIMATGPRLLLLTARRQDFIPDQYNHHYEKIHISLLRRLLGDAVPLIQRRNYMPRSAGRSLKTLIGGGEV
jgi:hypothetical protein